MSVYNLCLITSYDRRFMLKIESGKSINGFLGFLEDYIAHLIDSPHSLIVKILGIYSVRLGGKSKAVHFIVMQSVFWPSSRDGIHQYFYNFSIFFLSFF
jgi:phosphatidylinositol-4-phosphate 5-kinase-like protein 1